MHGGFLLYVAHEYLTCLLLEGESNEISPEKGYEKYIHGSRHVATLMLRNFAELAYLWKLL